MQESGYEMLTQEGQGGEQLSTLYGQTVDPLRQERMNRYQQSQDRINELVNEKIMKEASRKQEVKAQAQVDLQEWSNKQAASLESKRQNNREKQSSLLSSQAVGQQENKWQVVVDNIEVKETQYPGSKDVARMRQAIQGRAEDLAH